MKKSNRILAIILPVFCVAIAMLGLCLGLGLKANGGKPAEAAIQTGASTADKSLKGGVIFLDHNQESVFEGGVMQGKSRRYGGAVYVSSGATFTMKGGTITGNQALYGGAIYVEAGGICNIEGGRIEGNSAQHVPGIFLEEGAVLNITGDAVVDNNFYRAYEVELNIFVDGNLTSTDITNLETKLTDFGLPLTDEQCCGYFVDDELKLGVDTNARVFAVAQMNKEMESVRNENDIEVANLYTKTATVSSTYFSLNSATDTYTFKINRDGYQGTTVENVVVPRMYNGKKVDSLGIDYWYNNSISYDNTYVKTITYPTTIVRFNSSGLKDIKNLKSFYIRETLVDGFVDTSIYYKPFVFWGCVNLEKLEVSAKHPKYDSRDNCNAIIDTQTNTLVFGIKTTVIPESVTKIGNSAFNKNTHLTNINIPSSVTEIGQYAFSECSNLANVTFNEGLTTISNYAFQKSAIQTVTFPNSLTTIGSSAFYETSSLTSIVIGNGIKKLDSSAFSSTGITGEITIPASITELGSGVFADCKSITKAICLQNCNIPYGLFRDCSNLSEIVLGENIKKIDGLAFASTALTELIIPDNVERIDNRHSFQNCKALTKVYIGKNVSYIDEYFNTFAGCSALEKIIVSEENPYYDSRENCNAIVNSQTNQIVSGCKNTIFLDSFTGISGDAFDGCTGLERVVLKENIKSLGGAFRNCSNLKEIIILGVTGIENWYGSEAFSGCTSLQTIYLSKSIKSMNSPPFRYTNSSVEIYCQYSESEIPSGWGTNWNYNSSTKLETHYGVSLAEYCQTVHGTTPVVDTPVGCEIDGVSHIDCDICGRIEIVAPAVGHKVEIKANGDGTCLNCGEKLDYAIINGDVAGLPGFDITKDGFETSCNKESNTTGLFIFAFTDLTIDFEYFLTTQGNCSFFLAKADINEASTDLFEDNTTSTRYIKSSVTLKAGEVASFGFTNWPSEDSSSGVKIRNLKLTKWTETVEPTCTETGERQGVDLLTGKTVTETLPMLMHNVETWTVTQEAVSCTEPGHKHGTCTRCNKTIEADIVIDHDADISLGLSEFTCKSCNEKLLLAYTGQKYVDENTILVDSSNQFYIWTTTQKKVTITFEYFNDGLASLNIVSGHMPEGSTDPVITEHITEKNNTITFKTFTITLEPGDALAIQLLDKDGQYDINENAKAYIRNLVVTEVEA